MISRRALEIVTATLTGTFGAAIAISSLRTGVGWTPRGVDSGTFPFIASALVVAGSLYNLARGFARGSSPLIEGPGIVKLLALFVPALIFVAAIPLVGLHLAAAIYVFGVVATHKPRSVARAIAFGVATPLALYLIFDWGFSVTLPRGWLGAALGF